MKLLVFTEGGSIYGFGHISRCAALVQALKERIPGINVRFVIDADKDAVDFLKTSIDCEIIQVSFGRDEDIFADNARWPDMVVIDSYRLKRTAYDEISGAAGHRVLMLDDYKRIDYPKGIVLNSSICAGEMNYPAKDGVVYFLGKDYIVLRKDFWDVPDKHIADIPKKVLMTFGGAGNRTLAQNISRLIKSDFGLDTIDTGSGILKVDDMLAFMLDADICISGGGQTLYELLRVGVPTASICLADNQEISLGGLRNRGVIEYAGKNNDKGLLDNLRTSINNLLSREERIRRKELGRSLLTGKMTEGFFRQISENLLRHNYS